MASVSPGLKPEFEWVSQPRDQSIRYLQHGFPCELVRWHYHQEYELHLIKATSGKVFVGDYIGNFAPGQLILVGPNLPHNWISQLPPGQSVALRDKVVNFSHDFIVQCSLAMPEMQGLAPFWQKAQHGIEFLDSQLVAEVDSLLSDVQHSSGFRRLNRFWLLIEKLAATDNIKLLSSASQLAHPDQKMMEKANTVISYLLERYQKDLSLNEVAGVLGMAPSYFSKFFKKATGHRFVDFLNGLRVNKACELLTQSVMPITDIGYAVGYNNIANFNRRFYAIKDMTPSEYRRAANSR